MRKGGFIKLCIIITTVILSFFVFLSTRYEFSQISGIVIPFSFIIALPLFLYYKYDIVSKTKYKKPYLLIMSVLFICALLIISLLTISVFFVDAYITDELGNKIPTSIFYNLDYFYILFSSFLFMTTQWLMMFFGFDEMDKKDSKINYFLIVLSSLIIVFIHVNYLTHDNLQGKETWKIGETALYVTQNYLYFGIMYGAIIINKFRNKDKISF